MRFAAIYGNGAAMGFAPQSVRAMSMFQFFAAVDGWMKANVPEEETALSEREREELWEFIGG
ncbi:hypothetical protein [Agrobacterium vitis]|uniref:Uncharacterized protein n=1 Tax=Agrobacterium vitis TaxID=373 RepID=A0AAE2RDA8_AGRVI|nr:hypothetical protein [Agrobacterium vitis]MBF2716263.1 hypothetical protein [Agrobacterium vitis]